MRSLLRFRILALALALVSLAVAPVAAQGKVRWRDKGYLPEDLPEDCPQAALDAIATWAEWAEERGYRLDLEDGGRLLLISPTKGGTWRKQMRLINRVVERFEEALPAPERGDAAPAGPGGPGLPEEPTHELPEEPDDGPLPEDPEGDAPGFGDAPGEDYYEWTTEWGTETVEPDTETATFFVAKTDEDFAAICARMAELRPYLADWSQTARAYTGFTLTGPLAGAYVAAAAGQEEWNPDNELVHRVAELLLLRRFGQQPYWITQGWAWHVEEDLLGGIYCYPYRTEFVWATEHTAWPGELRKEFADAQGDVTLQEIAFPRGRYDNDRARRAFGAMRFLAEECEGRLSGALEALRLHADAENRVDQGDGKWIRDRFYEPPLDAQTGILKEHVGEDVLREMTRWFRLGPEYRPE